LSSVAREITGTRWNGLAFFGLTAAPKPKSGQKKERTHAPPGVGYLRTQRYEHELDSGREFEGPRGFQFAPATALVGPEQLAGYGSQRVFGDGVTSEAGRQLKDLVWRKNWN
jgi:hypothetical protein